MTSKSINNDLHDDSTYKTLKGVKKKLNQIVEQRQNKTEVILPNKKKISIKQQQSLEEQRYDAIYQLGIFMGIVRV